MPYGTYQGSNLSDFHGNFTVTTTKTLKKKKAIFSHFSVICVNFWAHFRSFYGIHSTSTKYPIKSRPDNTSARQEATLRQVCAFQRENSLEGDLSFNNSHPYDTWRRKRYEHTEFYVSLKQVG